MARKTITLSEDAYERLQARKREGESCSDVVRRLASEARLTDYHGVLSPETADELEEQIEDRRDERRERRARRSERLGEQLEDS